MNSRATVSRAVLPATHPFLGKRFCATAANAVAVFFAVDAELLEAAIEVAKHKMLAATTPANRIKAWRKMAWRKMAWLISQRSPEQIARIELERNLK